MSKAFPVYASPNEESGIINAVQINDRVCVLEAGEWTHVHFKKAGESVDGWVHNMTVRQQAQPY